MKYILVILGLYGAYYYVDRHFEFHDALVYAKNHPEARWSPAIDYYAGMVYYQRSQYPKAQEAFAQLLTDYPTGQYAQRALMRLEDSAEFNHDWPAAKDALNRYIEEFPEGRDIELARKRLELLKYHHP